MNKTGSVWAARQEEYWDSIAPGYDQKYSDIWSQYENALVQRRIAGLLPRSITKPMVLEFGCGTGLGYNLLLSEQMNFGFEYIGIDVSPAMLQKFSSRVPEDLNLINTSLELVPPDRFTNIDLVMGIFTSGSYVNMELRALLSLLRGWLKPHTGVMYISFLNRTSLTHIARWGLKSCIDYASRGTHSATVPARRYSKPELLRACKALGLAGAVHSLGPLAGLLQTPSLWRINATMLDATLFTHTIEITATRSG